MIINTIVSKKPRQAPDFEVRMEAGESLSMEPKQLLPTNIDLLIGNKMKNSNLINSLLYLQ